MDLDVSLISETLKFNDIVTEKTIDTTVWYVCSLNNERQLISSDYTTFFRTMYIYFVRHAFLILTLFQYSEQVNISFVNM